MPHFVINGPSNCPNFCHAIFVAQYLTEHLPNFDYKKNEVAPTGWGELLMKINEENNWSIMKSPVIWKEIHHYGGKRYLIGGLGEFWEYIYCYYGLESRITKTELRKLAADNSKTYQEKVMENEEKSKYVRIVSILGASRLITTLLLNDLLSVPNLGKRDGIIVRLYDDNTTQSHRFKIMEDTVNYYNSLCPFGSQQTVFIMDNMREMMEDCELLLIVDDLRPLPGQTVDVVREKWFARMNCLSDVLSCSKDPNLRIVVANHGPSSFIASCLVEFCTTVRPSDIVAISADQGLSYLKIISEKTGIPVANISGPPVWGFIGLNTFVDEAQIIFKADAYRPNKRSLTAPRGSTLPLGTIKSELRLMSYLFPDHQQIVRDAEEEKRKMVKSLERPAVLAKIRSIISLLKLWYADSPTGEIISLGVCSDGTFDIPPGMVFSQPVMLDSKHRWTPFSDFPLMNDFTRTQIRECVESASQVLKNYGLLYHACVLRDDDICSNPDCSVAELKRFNDSSVLDIEQLKLLQQFGG